MTKMEVINKVTNDFIAKNEIDIEADYLTKIVTMAAAYGEVSDKEFITEYLNLENESVLHNILLESCEWYSEFKNNMNSVDFITNVKDLSAKVIGRLGEALSVTQRGTIIFTRDPDEDGVNMLYIAMTNNSEDEISEICIYFIAGDEVCSDKGTIDITKYKDLIYIKYNKQQ